MNETDPIQELMKHADEIRVSKGYCPFQRRSEDGVRYCHALQPNFYKPHLHCPHLSEETITIVERDTNSVRIVPYFKSNFVPNK